MEKLMVVHVPTGTIVAEFAPEHQERAAREAQRRIDETGEAHIVSHRLEASNLEIKMGGD